MYLKVSVFRPSSPPSEVSLPSPHTHSHPDCCCLHPQGHRCLATLSVRGVATWSAVWWALPPRAGPPEMRQEGAGQPGSGRHFCRVRCFEVCGLPLLQRLGVQGTSMWVPPWLEGRGSQVPLLLSGYLQPWAPLGQEAGVVCAASSVDAEFFGAVGSAVPQDHVLSAFQPTHLWMCKKMELSVILGCFAEALLLPCGHLLGVNGKGVTGNISLHPGCYHSLHGPSSMLFLLL